MPLEITYWTKRASEPLSGAPQAIVSSEQRTISGTTASSGVTPDGAELVSVYATENARIAYAASPTASASSAYVGPVSVFG